MLIQLRILQGQGGLTSNEGQNYQYTLSWYGVELESEVELIDNAIIGHTIFIMISHVYTCAIDTVR